MEQQKKSRAAKQNKLKSNSYKPEAFDLTFPKPVSKSNNGIDSSSLQEDLSNGVMSNLFSGLTYIMPNPDPVLKKLGKDIDAYQELLSDPQLYGAIENNRKPGVTSLLMYLDNPDGNQNELNFIKTYFDRLRNKNIYSNCVNKSLDTSQFGWEVFGTVWGNMDNCFVPLQISAMPHKLCKFDLNGKLLVSTDGSNFNYPDHPAKYIVLQHKATIENPYGEPLLSRCYWNVRFKRDGFKLWALFTEKYGMPWVTAKYNPAQLAKAFNVQDISSAANKLLESLSNMAKDGIIVFPDGTEINIAKTGDGAINTVIFEKLVRICDEQNTKLQLGHSGATESTSGDKLSNDRTAEDIRKAVIDSDKQYPVMLFNELIYWIHQFNFSGNIIPKYDLFAREDVDMALAERDAMLVPVLSMSGKKFSQNYLEKNYGFEKDDLEDWDAATQQTTLVQNPPTKSNTKSNTKPTTKAEAIKNLIQGLNKEGYFNATNKLTPDQEIIDGAADTASSDNRPTDILLNVITDYLENKNDFKEALASLAKLFPKMNSDELQAKLEQILFMADVVGRLSVQDELGI